MVVASTAHAQFRLFNGIDEIEILAGPALVSFYGVDYGTDFDYDTKIKVGYSAGFGIGWHLNKRMSINVKFLFERKGRDISFKTNYFDEPTEQFKIGEVESFYNLNYLSAPITIEYMINKKRNFFMEGGPYISYLLKAQRVINSLYDGTRTIALINDDLAQVDWGITLAIGYSIPIKLVRAINLRLFATYGLMDISDYPDNISFQKAYNQSIGLSFGFVKNIIH